MKTKKRNKLSTLVPIPRFYRKTRRWAVDYDYLRGLGPADMKWLAQFTDEYYAADFGYESPLHKTQAERRERYRAQNSSWHDATSRAGAAEMLDFVGGAGDKELGPDLRGDFSSTPGYQREQEYREVLAECRKIVDVPARRRTAEQAERLILLQDYLLSYAESEGAGPTDEDIT